ncbi:MAG: hypothetical protein U9N59_05015 [Campylobacterota bacterium]|nr:hypothetical protein [Campylobacterota bacterium]
MKTIGRGILKEIELADKVKKKIVNLEIRTLDTKINLTLDVNTNKYLNGEIKPSNLISGKEKHPDYIIWGHTGKRGEAGYTLPVGEAYNQTSKQNIDYKQCKVLKGVTVNDNFEFKLYKVAKDKTKAPDHIFNIVSYADEKQKQNNYPDVYNQQPIPQDNIPVLNTVDDEILF